MHPILFIHGFPYDATMWQHQAAHLRAKKHTVLTPNLPGFGAGSSPLSQTTIESFADFIHALIQKEAGGKAIVAGFSMGGYTLLELLRKYPADVAAAIFIDTRPDADSPDARTARMNAINDLHSNGNANLIQTSLTKQFTPAASPAALALAKSIMQNQPIPTLTAALLAMANRRDNSPLLPQISVPTLILVGEEDAITPPAIALGMNLKIPNSALFEIPRAGHMSPLEQPVLVNEILEKFVAKLK